LIAHGATGGLRWRELETFGAVMPVAKTSEDPVELIIPMPKRHS
jgi:hypothetical protein